MAKIKKVKLPKNRILILLTLILVLSICLLSLTIVKGNSVLDNEYDETYTSVAVEKSEGQKPQSTSQPQSEKILRSSNGRVTVTERNPFAQDRRSSVNAANSSGSVPSITADTEISTAPASPTFSIETTAAYAAAGIPVSEDGITIKRFTVTTEQAAEAALKAQDGYTFSAVQNKGTLIFVFDDAGHNVQQLQPFLELPFPVTIAVLPGLDYSVQTAQMSRKAGKEVLLHQPMQAQNIQVNPGPRAVTPDMSVDQVRSLLIQNLADVSPVSGINNHEGSLITADKVLLGAVLDVCHAEGLYFLDSRTTAQSVAMQVSLSRGQKVWERSVFLDNSQDKAAIVAEIRRGMDIAARNGMAIMIGHVWTESLPSILLELYPEMLMQGFKITTISQQ